MKTILVVKPHSVLPYTNVVELWWGGRFIGAIYGADGPGLRIISRHNLAASPEPDDEFGKRVLGVKVEEAI